MIIFKLRKRARRKLEFEDVYTLEEHWSWLLSHYITKTCEPCKDGLHRPAINGIAPIMTENILECDSSAGERLDTAIKNHRNAPLDLCNTKDSMRRL
ncbi:hypothetical protein QNH28_10940 [Paenibacillus sp. G2S3]|uniref:hypothetical protein n=1 Tax=Paenibacillus sp. G2S3 TaxID=3047872 RepID=UPI0024C1C1F4|nr:hypothetical protein [Paenibacillus sp. G2S3]WHY21457.1 hypothetical protein QNH28_10940 [Paenibacillus sp. G2S3]